MGRLSGLRYREIVKKLKTFGFAFDRQAAGSHEIWYNPEAKPAGRSLVYSSRTFADT